MNDPTKSVLPHQRISAADLRMLPANEQTVILKEQVALAVNVYRKDRRLTDFEAFGEDDLYVDATDTEEG